MLAESDLSRRMEENRSGGGSDDWREGQEWLWLRYRGARKLQPGGAALERGGRDGKKDAVYELAALLSTQQGFLACNWKIELIFDI